MFAQSCIYLLCLRKPQLFHPCFPKLTVQLSVLPWKYPWCDFLPLRVVISPSYSFFVPLLPSRPLQAFGTCIWLLVGCSAAGTNSDGILRQALASQWVLPHFERQIAPPPCHFTRNANNLSPSLEVFSWLLRIFCSSGTKALHVKYTVLK